MSGVGGVSSPVTPTAPNGPGTYQLQLGSVFFWTSECPEVLPLGVSQMQVTHQLTGGSRVVQTFGPSAEDVSWSGRFWAPNIATRVAQLRLYTVNGIVILLSWKGEQYLAIISKFTPKFRGAYCDYDIELVITQSENGALSTSSPISIDTQISNLFVQAQNANQAILSSYEPTVPALATLNAAAPSLPAGTSAAVTAAADMQQPLTNLQAAIQQYAPVAANIPIAGPAIASAAQLASQAIATYQKALSSNDPNIVNAALLQASVTAIGANATRGQNAASIITQAESAFDIAAQQYGDVTQGYALAQANGNITPFLSAQTTATTSLPPFQSASTNTGN